MTYWKTWCGFPEGETRSNGCETRVETPFLVLTRFILSVPFSLLFVLHLSHFVQTEPKRLVSVTLKSVITCVGSNIMLERLLQQWSKFKREIKPATNSWNQQVSGQNTLDLEQQQEETHETDWSRE